MQVEKLKTSKSTGHDNIPAKLFYNANDAVAPFLVFIFNSSLKHGIFSNDLIFLAKLYSRDKELS